MIIPFIYHNPEQESGTKGAAISLLGNTNAKKGEDILPTRYDSSGFYVGGVVNASYNFKGCEIAGLANFHNGWSKGVQIAGLLNSNDEELTGVAITGGINFAKINKGLAIQIGAFNILEKYDSQGTVIQLGLFNKAGEQYVPLLNIRRSKNSKKQLEGRVEAAH